MVELQIPNLSMGVRFTLRSLPFIVQWLGHRIVNPRMCVQFTLKGHNIKKLQYKLSKDCL